MSPTLQTTQAAAQIAPPWWQTYIMPMLSSGILGSALTASIGYAARKRHPKAVQAEMSDRISSAFQRLVDELQEENRRHLAMIEALRTESQSLRARLARLQAFAQALFRYADELEAQVRDLGGCPVERPDLPGLSSLD